MEYRRIVNFPCRTNLGCDTLLAPQLEDYDALRHGYSHHISNSPPSFKLVLNVVCLSPKELMLTFPKDKILQVTARHGGREFMNLSFARDCTIRFVIPDDVDKNKLVAHWFSDHYLLICEEERSAGGSRPGTEATESSSGSRPGVEAIESSSGSRPGVEAIESSSGLRPGVEATESSNGSCPVAESTKSSNGSCLDVEAIESSSIEGPNRNSKNGNDVKSGPVNAPKNGHRARDSDLEEGPKDKVTVLKPVLVNRNLKPFIDLDEIRELITDARHQATVSENFLLNFFFTNPNGAWQKMKQKNPSFGALLSI